MRNIIYIILFVSPLVLFAQTGFYSLNLPASGRIAALGGYGVSQADGDLSIGYHNPAVLDSVDVGDVFFMFNPYLAGINRFHAAAQTRLGNAGNFSFGTVYLDYGGVDETDDIGNVIGEYRARDYVIYVGKAHQVGPFTLGANLKLAGSVLAGNGGAALMMDLGGIYRHATQDFTVGLVMKNLGFVISDYTPDQSLSLPFDVEIGTTFKPEHMPIRFSITASNLTRTYDELFIANPNQEPGVVNQLFRYINLGTAVVFGRGFEAIVGYNHRRREELKLDERAFGAGFSYGLLLRIKEFELRYSRAVLHAAGGSNFVSVATNTSSIKNIF